MANGERKIGVSDLIGMILDWGNELLIKKQQRILLFLIKEWQDI